ncbi:hypothetical protein AAC387_Pa01g3561 [Persea americana]
MKCTRMDGTALDSIFMSTYPIEQFIPQNENADNDNEKPIAAIEQTLHSVEQCTQRGLNIDPDAGANAGSRAEIEFATNNPLSELVWSPRNGLSLKCTDCSLSEKKSPLFWSSESGNMIISSPTNIKAWESFNNVSLAVGDPRSTHLAPNLDDQNSNQETLVRSHESTEDKMPPSQAKIGLLGDLEPLTTMNVSAVDVNRDEDDRSPEKEMGMCSPIDTQMYVDFREDRMVAAAALTEKASLPVKHEDVKVDLLQIEPQCGDSAKETGFAPFEKSGEINSGNVQRASLADTLVSEASAVKQHYHSGSSMSISRSLDRKHAEPDLVFEENNRNKTGKNPEPIGIPCVDKLESTAENDVEPSKMEGMFCSQYSPDKSEAVGGSACSEAGIIVAYHVEGEGYKSPAENPGVSPMDYKAAPIEASPNNSKREGKERALSDTKVDRINSKGKDDSHESVESCNSRELFSKGKRAWSFERLLVTGGKRIKKQHNETHHPPSSLGQDSSFMNWISNMVKRFPKFYMEGQPSWAIAARPYQRNGSHDSPSTSLEKNQEDPHFGRSSFQNVLQTLHCPRIQLENKKNVDLNDQEGPKGSKVEVANKIPFDVSPPGEPDQKTVKFANFIPILNERPQVACPSIRPSIASASDTVLSEKRERNFGENKRSCSIACGLETGVIHSSGSSLRDDSGSLPEGKGIRQIVSVDPNTSSDLVTNKSKPLGSLWITRFSPNVSGPVSNTMKFNQETSAAIAHFTNCNSLLPQSQNAVFSIEEPNNLEVSHEASAEDHMNAQSRNIKHHSIGSSIPRSFKRMNIRSNQKLKSKLSTVLPYQGFKNSDATFSCFARRLDAVRHISPLKVVDSAVHADTLCYFCGIRGHTLKDCSWIIDSELKDLLKNLNLYDGADKTSCLCIKCFELSHWAIACPNASLKKQNNTHGNTSLAGNRTCDRVPQNQTPLANHDRRNMLQSEIMDGKHQLVGAYTASHGETSKTELMVQTNVGSKLSSAMVLNGWVLDSKSLKKNLPRDDCHKGLPGKGTSKELLMMGKSTTSGFESGSKEKQITPFHDHVNRQIPDIPLGTFQAIRKLRLSRTDILKWSKPPISKSSLEGFFLRLRLGKWEQGLGGTGYHMARISGAFQGRPCMTCKLPIPVDMGGLKCLVDRRYVSNHDFIEDELMTWWCATLKGDGRLPTEEDLSLKLGERKRYGF